MIVRPPPRATCPRPLNSTPQVARPGAADLAPPHPPSPPPPLAPPRPPRGAGTAAACTDGRRWRDGDAYRSASGRAACLCT